jgi:hypothetical protein
VGFVIITVLFAFFALQAWGEVARVVLQRASKPATISLLQLFGGAAAYAAAIGTFRRRPWAWRASIAWGLLTTALLMSLGPLLDLPAEARPGLAISAVSILLLSAGLALYLRSVIKAR